jgi:hypothetical protein
MLLCLSTFSFVEKVLFFLLSLCKSQCQTNALSLLGSKRSDFQFLLIVMLWSQASRQSPLLSLVVREYHLNTTKLVVPGIHYNSCTMEACVWDILLKYVRRKVVWYSSKSMKWNSLPTEYHHVLRNTFVD